MRVCLSMCGCVDCSCNGGSGEVAGSEKNCYAIYVDDFGGLSRVCMICRLYVVEVDVGGGEVKG